MFVLLFSVIFTTAEEMASVAMSSVIVRRQVVTYHHVQRPHPPASYLYPTRRAFPPPPSPLHLPTRDISGSHTLSRSVRIESLRRFYGRHGEGETQSGQSEGRGGSFGCASGTQLSSLRVVGMVTGATFSACARRLMVMELFLLNTLVREFQKLSRVAEAYVAALDLTLAPTNSSNFFCSLNRPPSSKNNDNNNNNDHNNDHNNNNDNNDGGHGGDKTRQLSVYDLSLVSRVGVLSGHTGPVTTVSCGDNWVLSGSSDSSLRLWQVRVKLRVCLLTPAK